MNSTVAYLRADVSHDLGLGHISRAIAMANALGRRGVQPVIFCRIIGREKGHVFRKLDRNLNLVKEIHSEEEFFSILERKGGKYLFIDLIEGTIYAEIIPRLKTIFPAYRTVCFDTFFDEDLKFDLFVRPFFDGTATAKNALTGLSYYVFPESLSTLVSSKIFPKEIQRVLITLGGSDPYRITPVIVRALCGAHPGLRFTVVVGPWFASVERRELLELAAQHGNMECVVEPGHLGHLYLASDFAITSGGLTKFETALFGIPSFIFANNRQEEDLSMEFSTLGASVFMGSAEKLDSQKLMKEFEQLLAQDIRFGEMSRKGRQILDIHGGERVIEYIQQNLS